MAAPHSRAFSVACLSLELQHKLDRLVERRGIGGAAKALGVSPTTVEALAFGGKARQETVDRVAAAVARI